MLWKQMFPYGGMAVSSYYITICQLAIFENAVIGAGPFDLSRNLTGVAETTAWLPGL